MMENYERILKKISESADIEKEEIERKIEAKRAKLSGLISREGAAQIIAAELGIKQTHINVHWDELSPDLEGHPQDYQIIDSFVNQLKKMTPLH